MYQICVSMKNQTDDKLVISDTAYQYLSGKNNYFAPKARYARIILNGVTCSGAQFSLFYDYAAESDLRMEYKNLTFLAEPELLQRFGGFELGTERFFFGTRILITPFIDDRNCDCDHKCNSHNGK